MANQTKTVMKKKHSQGGLTTYGSLESSYDNAALQVLLNVRFMQKYARRFVETGIECQLKFEISSSFSGSFVS